MGLGLLTALLACGPSTPPEKAPSTTEDSGGVAGVPANAPPVVARVTIEPDAPTSSTPLTLQVSASDPDGDRVTWTATWDVDGVEVAIGDSLPPAPRDATVTAVVVPSDGHQDGSPASAAPVRVGNSPPTVLEVQVTPPTPSITTGAACRVDVADVDGDDPTVEIEWFADGARVGTGPDLLPDAVEPGAALTCRARADDGLDVGPWAPSDPVTVANEAPEAPWVRIHPVSPRPDEAIWCVVDAPAWDPEGRPLDLRATWTVDGVPWAGPIGTHAIDGDHVPAGHTVLGERWTCTVTASDGAAAVASSADADISDAPGGNVLVLLADDMGVDMVGAYGEHPEPPPTPVLDGLAAEGVLFRHAYASASCSPTRASLLTGRYPRRSGLGEVVDVADLPYMLRLDEVLVPEVLVHSPLLYTSVALGKWHLAGYASPSGLRHPLDQGFAHHAGSFGNPGTASQRPEEELSYTYWEKVVDGEAAFTRTYMTTDTVDDALAQIASLPEPWFLYVAFNAPHDPFHLPPEHLHGFDLDESSPPSLRYAAMVEAMDTEIGRLLSSADPDVIGRTTVIFAGDNGTHERVIRPPWDASRSKTTLYEGGVNVPLVVSGPLVEAPGSESTAFVHVVDIFATVADIAGVTVHPPGLVPPVRDVDALDTDGLSLRPFLSDPGRPSLRRFVWSEKFADNGFGPYDVDGRTIHDGGWKLIQYQGGGESLFAFDPANWDEGPMIEAPTGADAAALSRLQRAAADHLERLTPEP